MKWSLYGVGIHFTGCAMVLLSNTKSKIPPLLYVVYLKRCIKWKYCRKFENDQYFRVTFDPC